MRQYIWMISCITCQKNYGLHIAWNLFLACNFVNKQDCTSVVSIELNIGKILDFGGITSGPIWPALANYKPVS